MIFVHVYFFKADNFCDFLFASMQKRIHSHRKAFAPHGALHSYRKELNFVP